MGNIVRGLRLMNDIDWTMWFETVSRIDEALREKTDFASLDFYSRDQYRTAIEDLARRSEKSRVRGHAEARSGWPAATRRRRGWRADIHSDVGFFLVGNRRQELEAEIGYVPVSASASPACCSAWAGSASCCRCFALTMLLPGIDDCRAGELRRFNRRNRHSDLTLFAVPAGEGALSFFNTVVLQLLKPTRLIGYEFKSGVPTRRARSSSCRR